MLEARGALAGVDQRRELLERSPVVAGAEHGPARADDAMDDGPARGVARPAADDAAGQAALLLLAHRVALEDCFPGRTHRAVLGQRVRGEVHPPLVHAERHRQEVTVAVVIIRRLVAQGGAATDPVSCGVVAALDHLLAGSLFQHARSLTTRPALSSSKL